MNLLLVDDEEYMIESIKKNVDWKDCGIDAVYTAFSVKQAQMIMEMADVDVIISDIVMPQESGFDLIEWVRSKGYRMSVIFLTSYAEFDYARRAIALDSVEYLLKPVDFDKLSCALMKAVQKAEQARVFADYQRESRHWKQNQSVICREFWREVLAGRVPSEPFGAEAQRRDRDYLNDSFFLLYVVFYDGKAQEGIWDRGTLYFVMGNVLSELLADSGLSVESVVSVESGSCVVICRESGCVDGAAAKAAFARFVSWFQENFEMNLWAGAGAAQNGFEMAKVLAQVRRMRDNSLSVWNRVLYLSDFIHPENTYRNPNMGLWEIRMEEGKEEALAVSMRAYLEEMERQEMVTRQILEAFRVDVTQIVYSWLARREIKAHLLFSEREDKRMHRDVPDGIYGALAYASDLIHEAVRYEKYVNRTATVTEKIRQYIDSHYQEEIRRDALAEMVYLNTDYMARIFKKEVGISISAYILQKRVEEARNLLVHSDLPINTVSIYVGYSNFSYFTKMFKDNTGYSPLEYRRKFKE
ncbi:MAG: helix-turn-helix domain-containing protein [Lachnospiraceae bacterium]|nr:helix-turn-helix domain-containing protein [Lachnospiraceae bacterium]